MRTVVNAPPTRLVSKINTNAGMMIVSAGGIA
jgi:hypothetical protein